MSDFSPLRMRQGVGEAQFGQAAFEARHVLGKAEQLAAVDRHHLVHAVTKNEAAVHDADLGVGQCGEFTVEVAVQGGEGIHG